MTALHQIEEIRETNGGVVAPPLKQTALGLTNIRLMTSQELAVELRFSGVNSAFRKFCNDADIRPVPGRRDCYDPIAVRVKLDRMQGLQPLSEAQSDSALIRSRMRRNA